MNIALREREDRRARPRRWRQAAFSILTTLLCGCAATPPNSTESASAEAFTSTAEAFRQLNAVARQAREQENPLAAYLIYRKHHEHSTGLLHDLIGQVVAAKQSELGAYRRAVLDYPFSPARLSTAPAPLPSSDDATLVPAADGIAQLARNRRIVMVNEAHHAAQTRLLTLALLPKLRQLGFNWFAAEGLNARDRDLSRRGYPVHDSGSYVREPVYGEIIRTALRLGFHVVSYDSTREHATPAQREHDQAQRLLSHVFAKDENARLFVHAGYAHVNERADYFFTDTLAMRLQQATGIDPLSVDQTWLRSHDAPEHEYPAYRPLIDRFHPHVPSVLLLDGGKAWSLQPSVFDVSVLLPPTQLRDGRPRWLDLDGARRAVPITPPAGSTVPFVIEARYAEEREDAVPADRQLLQADDDAAATLYLFPGDYRVDVLDESGRRLVNEHLHVPKTR